MNTRRDLLAGIGALGAAALGWAAWHEVGEAPQRLRSAAAAGGRLPNTPLYTHEGKAVSFYDDLVRGKVVAINMMYASCAGICPTATATCGWCSSCWASAWGATSSCTRSPCSPSWTRRRA